MRLAGPITSAASSWFGVPYFTVEKSIRYLFSFFFGRSFRNDDPLGGSTVIGVTFSHFTDYHTQLLHRTRHTEIYKYSGMSDKLLVMV